MYVKCKYTLFVKFIISLLLEQNFKQTLSGITDVILRACKYPHIKINIEFFIGRNQAKLGEKYNCILKGLSNLANCGLIRQGYHDMWCKIAENHFAKKSRTKFLKRVKLTFVLNLFLCSKTP